MEKINVNTSVNYDVLIGKGIIGKCGRIAAEYINPCKMCIITDDNVEKYYLDKVKNSFKNSGFDVYSFVFKNGEQSKNLETVGDILEFLSENHLTRTDCIAALGGGIVGDVSGFAASSYLRGIRFIQIPTTLLAAVDSSVGGKTGVNLKSGKNLCGAFHQPSLVICDPECFGTMKQERYLDGVSEAIKYAVLKDETLINVIDTDIEKAVCECVKIKRDIVSKDEFDTGERQLLNFGHTFGHAIEAVSEFSVTHGFAVAIGMVIASRAGEKLGVTEKGTSERIADILLKHNLPVSCEFSISEICNIALTDKKRRGNKITLVIPKRVGECVLKPIDVSELEALVGGVL